MADPHDLDPELVAHWNRVLNDEGLAVLAPRGLTPREKRDRKARSRQRSRGAGTF